MTVRVGLLGRRNHLHARIVREAHASSSHGLPTISVGGSDA